MHISRKKILITGGNSHIGQDLVKFFIKKYFVVSTFRRKKIKFKNKFLKQVKYDFSKKLNLNEKFDFLIHLAASTPTNSKTNSKMLEINKMGTQQILNSNFKFKSIVLISTLSVYGNIKVCIIDENKRTNKANYYGKSKLFMEKQFKRHAKDNLLNYLILRLPGVIGTFRSKTTFMNQVFETLFKNKTLFYANPESYTNNVIHTNTLAKIIDSYLIKNKPKNKTFNLCSNKKIKLKDLISMIKKQFKSNSKIKIKKGKRPFIISTKKLMNNKVKIINTKSTILKTIKFYKSI